MNQVESIRARQFSRCTSRGIQNPPARDSRAATGIRPWPYESGMESPHRDDGRIGIDIARRIVPAIGPHSQTACRFPEFTIRFPISYRASFCNRPGGQLDAHRGVENPFKARHIFKAGKGWRIGGLRPRWLAANSVTYPTLSSAVPTICA